MIKREELQLESGEGPIDSLSKKTGQLAALLMATYGAGYESFIGWNDEIKENYLWACSDLAQEIQKLSSYLACNGMDNR